MKLFTESKFVLCIVFDFSTDAMVESVYPKVNEL